MAVYYQLLLLKVQHFFAMKIIIVNHLRGSAVTSQQQMTFVSISSYLIFFKPFEQIISGCFPLGISSTNVTKSACGFGHIY